jgi:hypothetical protein
VRPQASERPPQHGAGAGAQGRTEGGIDSTKRETSSTPRPVTGGPSASMRIGELEIEAYARGWQGWDSSWAVRSLAGRAGSLAQRLGQRGASYLRRRLAEEFRRGRLGAWSEPR